jgi:hypothetical protein
MLDIQLQKHVSNYKKLKVEFCLLMKQIIYINLTTNVIMEQKLVELLLQVMENQRDDLILIFSGHKEKLKHSSIEILVFLLVLEIM